MPRDLGTAQYPFVFIHGGFAGAWCWERLVGVLDQAGVASLTLDLPGHGARAGEAHSATLGRYVDTVNSALRESRVTNGILVGHSLGGVVLPGVYIERHDQIAHLVYLGAVALADGESVLDELPPNRIAEFSARNVDTVAPPAADVAWNRWLRDLSPDDALVTWTLERLTPQPLRPLREPARIQAFYQMNPPRTYIWCSRDQAVPASRKDKAMRTLGPRTRYIEIDGDHDIMISNPDLLARTLLRIRQETMERR
jgi:pimeloyl-ACP methyl ester carboxylesterase